MPIYEYKCEKCQDRFEKLVRNSKDIPESCPSCGHQVIRKQFSTFSAATASAATGEACPAAATCPSGSCCSGGSCPF